MREYDNNLFENYKEGARARIAEDHYQEVDGSTFRLIESFNTKLFYNSQISSYLVSLLFKDELDKLESRSEKINKIEYWNRIFLP